jgi:tetratricopeptide (TPR) repeat protein
VLQGQEAALGPDHPHTLSTVNVLGCTLRSEASVALFRRALEGRAAALGDAHEETNNSRDCLAERLAALGRWEEALPLHVASAKAWERRFDNPLCDPVLVAQSGAAECLVRLQRWEEALALLPPLLSFQLPGNTTYVNVVYTIDCLAQVGRPAEAAALAQRELRAATAALGPDDPITQAIGRFLVQHALRTGDFDVAFSTGGGGPAATAAARGRRRRR